MSFTHIDKGPGDLIRSADWNAMGQEITRLNEAKLDRDGSSPFAGPLTVRGDVTVGATYRPAGLRVFGTPEDGTAPDHGAVILGTDAGASLRLGYSRRYSWIQGQGSSALAINPRGGNVGIGTDEPQDPLQVAGALRVGSATSPVQIGGDGGFGDNAAGNAEIFNDTTHHKGLVIAGNKSAGAGRRVSVLDYLEVKGSLAVTENLQVKGSLAVTENLEVAGRAQLNQTLRIRGDVIAEQAVSAGWMRVNRMWVPGGEDFIVFLRGCVNSDGSVDSDTNTRGFTVTRESTGVYSVIFDQAFSGRPAAVVTLVCPGFDNFDTSGNPCDTLDNALITGINTARMRVKTGDARGNISDRSFCFIVMGPR